MPKKMVIVVETAENHLSDQLEMLYSSRNQTKIIQKMLSSA